MTILITGIAGSLGRAFANLLKDEHTIFGIDNHEQSIVEFQHDFPGIKVMLEDFGEWKFDQDPCDLVIHCAALKHLPLGEDNINSFLDTNIISTRKLFAEAYKHNADIIFISTDKAVEPQSLYGYTKAIGEYLATKYNGYISRSGNLLNSNGSVIPFWEKAIRENKPIRITDFRMKRWVIETPEAAKQIWEGYCNKQKLIICECEELKLGELLNKVLELHNIKLEDYKPGIEVIGNRFKEKLEEKLKWDWE
jgi:FlaA1/EpsC-like NDP-sugar epimerase